MEKGDTGPKGEQGDTSFLMSLIQIQKTEIDDLKNRCNDLENKTIEIYNLKTLYKALEMNATSDRDRCIGVTRTLDQEIRALRGDKV